MASTDPAAVTKCPVLTPLRSLLSMSSASDKSSSMSSSISSTALLTRSDLGVMPRGLILQHKQHAQTSAWCQGDWYYNTNNTLRPRRDAKGTDTTTQTTHHIRNNLHNDISGCNCLRGFFNKSKNRKYFMIITNIFRVRSLQAAVLARSSRDISQTVRIDCSYFSNECVRISVRPSTF